MKNQVTVNDQNWADLSDIGMFSINESKWNNFTDSEFEQMGADIVNNTFKGSVVEAYRSICAR